MGGEKNTDWDTVWARVTAITNFVLLLTLTGGGEGGATTTADSLQRPFANGW